MYNLKNMGLKIKQVRKKQGISQEKLAEMTNMNLKTIIRVENAQCSPSIDTIIKIANVLNIKVTDLFETQDYKTRTEIITDIQNSINLMNDEELTKFYKSIYYYIH